MYQYPFEKLKVWENARDLTLEIYQTTSQMGKSEQYNLVSQMRRSSVSVCSNLAEGSGRNTYRDQAHFTTIAFGSLMELLNQVIIAENLKIITHEQLTRSRAHVDIIAPQLIGLRKSQLQKSEQFKSVSTAQARI